MFFKKKVTLQQIVNGLMYTGQQEFESFCKIMITDKTLPNDLQNPYDWEISHFIFSSIYLIILHSQEFQAKEAIINLFFDTFKKNLNAPSKIAEQLSIQLHVRATAYDIAFRKNGIMGLYKLLSNVLLSVKANSDPSKFVDGFIESSKVNNNEAANQFYTRAWVPSAHALMNVTDQFNTLSQVVTGVLGDFTIAR